ncbi:MAG: MlaD family protein [Thermoanaerobaculia bacterium]|jgi:phospholipid/cholesterol/gamma-HCH transport system substrate-binding protein
MTTQSENARNVRIGLLVTAAAVALLIFLFFIGSEQKLFSKKYEYEVRFPSAQGLAEGNPVHMSGVNVGVVKEIRLPEKASQKFVEITISVDRKFAARIREDSRARLKKLGLIASDSYVDIVPGSPDSPALHPGSDIPAARQANVDDLLGQGEDLVDNFVSISSSLRNVLERVDRGEGLLGELTSSPESKEKVTQTLLQTMTKVNRVLDDIERGRGLMGRLVTDDVYADRLLTSLGQTAASVQTIAASIEQGFETGEGAIPALMNDPEQKKKVITLIGNLEVVSTRLASLSEGFEGKGGVIPRLIKDEPYADKTLAEFQSMVSQLNAVSKQLSEGNGTAGKLIQDPSVYESANDILIGINESKMLRWLVRRSQAKGIEERYRAERASAGTDAPPPPVSTVPEDATPTPEASPSEIENPAPPATVTAVEPGPEIPPPPQVTEPPAEETSTQPPPAEPSTDTTTTPPPTPPPGR